MFQDRNSKRLKDVNEIASKMFCCWQLNLTSFLVMGGAIALSATSAFAQNQITSDGTLGGESSVVAPTPDSPNDAIQGGAIRGKNLFHSFQEFNISEGRGAYFANPNGVENIFSRVTGSSKSNIQGLLGVLGSANLFFLNPNGIIFGQNARLDVRGSFIASTASSLKFADRTEFSATQPQKTPLLTISVPIGLQFGEKAAGIQVIGQGQGIRRGNTNFIDTNVGLRVQPQQTLALVGGDLALEGGTLKTAGGRIELGSIEGSSSVSLTPINQGWFLGYEDVKNFRDLQLSQQASVDASGAGGGDIQIQGRRITIGNGSQIEASTLGSEPGGTLSVSATDLVELIGTSGNTLDRSGLITLVSRGANGAGGNLTINTGRLIVRDGALVSAGTSEGSEGQGGNLTVTTSDSVQVVGYTSTRRSAIATQTEGSGNAGNLTIATQNLLVQDGAFVSASSTLGSGKGGELEIDAANSVNLIGVDSQGLSSGLFTSITRGTGEAGNITVDTSSLQIADGAVINALTNSASNGGNIQVQANTLETARGGQILTATRGSGRAGNINLNVTNRIALSGSDPTFAERFVRAGNRTNNAGAASGIFANTAANSTGAGGNLNIATGELTIGDGARVSVSSEGTGDAGRIDVAANSIWLDDRAAIAAATNSGRGGNINLQTQNLLTISRNSEISTNAVEFGNGGNINIDTDLLTLVENSNITAKAIAGVGGNIQISAQGLFLSPDSNISASSDRGIDGIVEINRPDFDPNAELVVLPTEIVDVSGLIAQGCSAGENPIGSEESQFVVTGRGGLPYAPQDALNMDAVVEDWGFHSATVQKHDRLKERSDRSQAAARSNSTTTSLVEAQSWQIGDRGEVVLTASANLPYNPASNPATCHAD